MKNYKELKEQFDIEYQYKKYLDTVKLDESKMHPTQKVETKRAFIAGMTYLMLLMDNELVEIPEEEGAILLTKLHSQIKMFWLK